MNIRMPFGKHRGKTIQEIPKDYLRWLLKSVDLQPWLLSEVRSALGVLPTDTPVNAPGSTRKRSKKKKVPDHSKPYGSPPGASQRLGEWPEDFTKPFPLEECPF